MNCIIPGGNMKVINKAIQALSKLSDELYIECKPDCLSFKAMNSNKTAYSKYDFQSIFFQTYEVESADTDYVRCKVLLKSILNIFKQKMDRKIEICKIELSPDATKMVFKLRYKMDVTIVHSIKLMDTDYLTFDYDIEDAKNKIAANGEFFNQILSNFSVSDSNLSLEVSNDKTILRNYDVGESTVYKGIRSQIVLAKNEFNTYTIGQDTSIVLPLKPFRSAIQFAEHFNIIIDIYFQTGGYPIILCMKNSTFNVDYVIATISPDGFTQTTTATALTNVRQNNTQVSDITVHDQAAMQSINWGDDFQNDGGAKTDCSSDKATVGAKSGSPLFNLREIDRNCDNGTNSKKATKEYKSKFENGRRNANKCIENVEINPNDLDVVCESPESKRAKIIYGRCFDPTFHASMLDFGDVLAGNSDSDD